MLTISEDLPTTTVMKNKDLLKANYHWTYNFFRNSDNYVKTNILDRMRIKHTKSLQLNTIH